MGEGERGFCGLRMNEGGRLRHLAGTSAKGVLHWCRDPLPTNCVADYLFLQNWHEEDGVAIGRNVDSCGSL